MKPVKLASFFRKSIFPVITQQALTILSSRLTFKDKNDVSHTSDSKSPAGLFLGKYGINQVFSCCHLPSYPKAGSCFEAGEFKCICDSTHDNDERGEAPQLTDLDWGEGKDYYLRFVDIPGQSSINPNGYQAKLNLYAASGTLIRTLVNSGKIYGLDSTGFLFVSTVWNLSYYFSNHTGSAVGKSITYTPAVGLVTSKSILDAYIASKDYI